MGRVRCVKRGLVCVHDTHSLTHFPSHSHSHTQRIPPGHRDLVKFLSRNPGLVKWTRTALLLLYSNAGFLSSTMHSRVVCSVSYLTIRKRGL